MSEPGSGEVEIPTDTKTSINQKTIADLDMPAEKIQVRGNLKGSQATSKDVVETLQRKWLKEREDILQLSSQEDGLRMDRIHAFRERIGIPEKAIRILSPEDYAKLKKIVEQDDFEKSTEGGQYLPHQDVIVVKRDPDLESINGPELTESLIVHEIAHSANGNKAMRADVETTKQFMRKRKIFISPSVARSGFVVRTDKDDKQEGYFLEEGYAELERGLYVAGELGKPDGFGKGVQPGESHPINKYTFLKKTGTGEEELIYPPGSIPAMTLSLLIDHDPELLPALRESRRSVEGLREVARRINAISPSLYQELRKFDVESTADGYIRATHMFKEVENLFQGKSSSFSNPSVPK